MNYQELAEFRELAGLNEPQSSTEFLKQWADKQLTNIPKVENPLPVPSLQDFSLLNTNQNDFNTTCSDKELEGLASRLNSLLGNDFSNSIKIQRL